VWPGDAQSDVAAHRFETAGSELKQQKHKAGENFEMPEDSSKPSRKSNDPESNDIDNSRQSGAHDASESGRGKSAPGKEDEDKKEQDHGQKGDTGGNEGPEGDGKGNGENSESSGREIKEPEEEKKPPMRVRSRRWVRAHPWAPPVFLVLLVGAIIGGIILVRYLGSYESTDDAEIDGHIDPITARISGTVVKVFVEDNQQVVPSQTLVELDPTDYNVAVEQARADLAQAQGQLEAETPNVPITETTNATTLSTSQADVDKAEAALAAARNRYQAALADWRQAEAGSLRAQRDEVRYRELVEKDETSRELYGQRLADSRANVALTDSKRAAADAAAKMVGEQEAELAQARQRLEEANKNSPRQVVAHQAAVQSRKANVDAARAQLDQALLNLSYHEVLAPTAGVVGNRTVEVGQHVQAGEQLLAITENQDLWVTANFKETELRDIRPGQRVTIHVDTLSRDFNGYVESLPGATGAKYSLLPPENATGNYVKVVQRLPVRIRFYSGQDGLDQLRQGMSVEPKVWVK